MEAKIIKVLIFKKGFFFIFLFSFSFLLLLVNHKFYYGISNYFVFSFEEKIIAFDSNFVLDKTSHIFCLIVILVTRLVLLYSEVYIETYKNKKFFVFTLLFFFFMFFISFRGRLMNLMIGWDGLGISSLFLIIFYPNKITFFNSFLTFFFNRLGDVLFLSFFCYFLINYRLFFHFIDYRVFLFLFFLCLLTKRAQIPFSSWLPAAISAPTPISAMVHSSTLVTAGIFVFFKVYYIFETSGIFYYLFLVSSFTFLLGGFLGCLELDLKKIVAFSTIRQIRMILFFISATLYSLAYIHIFNHAIFKTLLFCGCGLIFLSKYRDQLSKNLFTGFNLTSVILFFVVRIYSIRGIIFSSSFFTKDIVLEFLLEEKSEFLFLLIIIGRIFTILYSSNIFKNLRYNSMIRVTNSFKNFLFPFILTFTFLLISVIKFFIEIRYFNYYCILRRLQTLLLNLLILFFFFYSIKFNNRLKILRSEISFLKNTFFSIYNKILSKNIINLFSSDNFIFKIRNFSLPRNVGYGHGYKNFRIFLFIILFLLISISIYSFSLT